MVLVSVNLFEQDIRVVFFDGLDLEQEEGLDAIVDDFASVFGRKDQVVVTQEDGVGVVAVRWHSPMIYQAW